MKLTSAVQEGLLALICYDPESAKLVHSLVPWATFDAFYRDVAREAEAYQTKYGKVPGSHTYDIVQSLKARAKDKGDRSVYSQLYDSMQVTKGEVNAKYVLDLAQTFARAQHYRSVLAEALDVGEANDEESVKKLDAIFAKAQKPTTNLWTPGTLFSDPRQSLRFLEEQFEPFPLGIPPMDEAQLGPGRGKLLLLLGAPKRGKSWGLLHIAKHAILAGKRVLYVSLELSEELLCARAFQSFFSMTKRETENLSRMAFKKDELGRFVAMRPRKIPKRRYLQDPRITKHLVKLLGRLKHRPPLLFKKFPMRSITVRDLDAYIDTVEAQMGWMPDLLCLDYAGILKFDVKNYRHAATEAVQELVGLADRRNLACASAWQLNRASLKERTADESNIAEAWEVIAAAHTVLTYNQTADEKELGLARLHVAVGREEADKITFLISQAYSIGQFAMDATRMTSEYWSHVETPGDDEEGEGD